MMTQANWRDQVHPATALFPMMRNAELDNLAEDIKANGLRTPVILLQDGGKRLILDGRNRLEAIERAGLSVRKYLGTAKLYSAASDKKFDPYAFVLSVNIHRRHLTPEKKLELVEEVLKARPRVSDRQVAEQTKTSPTTVGKIRKKLEKSGLVSTVDTRQDARGRQQPASKPPSVKQSPATSHFRDSSPTVAERAAQLVAEGQKIPGAPPAAREGFADLTLVEQLAELWRAATAEQQADFLNRIGAALVSPPALNIEPDTASEPEQPLAEAAPEPSADDLLALQPPEPSTSVPPAEGDAPAVSADDGGLIEVGTGARWDACAWRLARAYLAGEASDLMLPRHAGAISFREARGRATPAQIQNALGAIEALLGAA